MHCDHAKFVEARNIIIDERNAEIATLKASVEELEKERDELQGAFNDEYFAGVEVLRENTTLKAGNRTWERQYHELSKALNARAEELEAHMNECTICCDFAAARVERGSDE